MYGTVFTQHAMHSSEHLDYVTQTLAPDEALVATSESSFASCVAGAAGRQERAAGRIVKKWKHSVIAHAPKYASAVQAKCLRPSGTNVFGSDRRIQDGRYVPFPLGDAGGWCTPTGKQALYHAGGTEQLDP